MRFLVFVSCCGPTVMPAVRPESSQSSSATPPAEETRSLVRSRRYRRRPKRGRLGASGSAPVPVEWKPSLCSISEDNVVMVERSDGQDRQDQYRTAGPERLVKRKSGSGSSRMNVVASFGDDYGRSSFPTVIPAFSPTPFMF
ncbi:hypothetical protein L484_021141 [Morus notabilis]|uniref:Uncharacterized protein n=1 Tax=Morus notabilis TaxID=981085 RepID=W9QQS7_9ROSA|nr:uncharacterized protein LOC21404005 [Morus notabilis]EXB50914.1 hypothetical protein L484_021141 [Morus notabilis]